MNSNDLLNKTRLFPERHLSICVPLTEEQPCHTTLPHSSIADSPLKGFKTSTRIFASDSNSCLEDSCILALLSYKKSYNSKFFLFNEVNIPYPRFKHQVSDIIKQIQSDYILCLTCTTNLVKLFIFLYIGLCALYHFLHSLTKITYEKVF